MGAKRSAPGAPDKAAVKAAKRAMAATPHDSSLAARYKELKRAYNAAKRGAAPQESAVPEPSSAPEPAAAPARDVGQAERDGTAKKQKNKEQQQQQPAGDAGDADEAAAEGGAVLFVGNLDWSVDDDALLEALHSVVDPSEVKAIKWAMDREGNFRGFGHVTMASAEAAERAAALDGQELLGRAMRVNVDESAAASRKQKYQLAPAAEPAPNPDDVNRCFIGNLSFKIDKGPLFKALLQVGANAVHVFWATDKTSGEFYGSSFVTFATPRDAAMAVASNGMFILGRPARIEYAPHRDGPRAAASAAGKNPGKPQTVKPPSERPAGGTKTAFLGNLSFDMDDETIAHFCKEAGTGEIKAIRWLTHKDTGEFRGTGFLDFASEEDVDKLVAKNGAMLLGRAVRVDYS